METYRGHSRYCGALRLHPGPVTAWSADHG